MTFEILDRKTKRAPNDDCIEAYELVGELEKVNFNGKARRSLVVEIEDFSGLVDFMEQYQELRPSVHLNQTTGELAITLSCGSSV